MPNDGATLAEWSTLPLPTFRRLEVWSDLACDSGALLSTIPDALSCQIARSIDSEQTVTLRLPKLSPAMASIDYGGIITIRYADGSGEEWRVLRITDTASRDGVMTDIVAVHPLMDLAELSPCREVNGDGVPSYDLGYVSLTPEEYITNVVLPNCPAWVELGDIDPTIPLSLTFNRATPLAVVNAIVSAVRTARLACEFQFRRTATGYAIDLLSAIGQDADVITIEEGTHLTNIQQSGDDTETTTVAQPLGASDVMMWRVAWRVTVISGTVLELDDPSGAAGPVLVDDQMNDMALVSPVDGALHEITASDADTQRVTIDDTSDFTTGDLVEVRASTGGELVTDLALPNRRRKFGTVTDATLTGQYNVIPNPLLAAWSGSSTSDPDGWTARRTSGGPTYVFDIDRVTSPVPEFGPYGMHIEADILQGSNVPRIDTPLGPYLIVTPSTKLCVISMRLQLHVDPATFSAGLMLFDESDTLVTSIATDAESPQDEWFTLSGAVELLASGRYYLAIAGPVTTIGQKLEMTIGAVQFDQQTAEADFVEGSAANRLWHLANYQLARAGLAPVQYTATVIDHARIDPDRWAHVQMVLGGVVNVRSSSLDIRELLRLVAITEEVLGDAVASVAFAYRRRTLTQLLAVSLAV